MKCLSKESALELIVDIDDNITKLNAIKHNLEATRMYLAQYKE